MQKLNRLYQEGRIDVQTFGRATQQAHEQLQRFGAAGRDAFGPEALGTVRDYLSVLTGVGGALALAQNVMRNFSAPKEAAAQRAQQSEMSMGSLAELAGGDPVKTKALQDRAYQMVKTAGMSENKAAATIYAAESAGALDEVGIFEQLHAKSVMDDPAGMIKATKAFQAGMGKEKTGSLRRSAQQGLRGEPACPESCQGSVARSGNCQPRPPMPPAFRIRNYWQVWGSIPKFSPPLKRAARP